jgi:bifunctional ADP-heptose synthase (sugar kinase/adenylyltransferase)
VVVDALRSHPTTIIRGYFDPLYSAHIEALKAIAAGDQVVVALDHPANPVLPWRARAELLAALAVVRYVVDARECPAADVDLRAADLDRTAALAQHIASRNRTA